MSESKSERLSIEFRLLIAEAVIDARKVRAGATGRSRLDRLRHTMLLENLLRDGPRWQSELEDFCYNTGLGYDTMEKVKHDLGIKDTHVYDEDGKKLSVWFLPERAPINEYHEIERLTVNDWPRIGKLAETY